MDKFLQEFKNKVNNAREPEMTSQHWEQFIKFREIHSLTPVKQIITIGKSILSVISAAAISLAFIFSDQILPTFNNIYSDFNSTRIEIADSNNADNNNIITDTKNEQNNYTQINSQSLNQNNKVIVNIEYEKPLNINTNKVYFKKSTKVDLDELTDQDIETNQIIKEKVQIEFVNNNNNLDNDQIDSHNLNNEISIRNIDNSENNKETISANNKKEVFPGQKENTFSQLESLPNIGLVLMLNQFNSSDTSKINISPMYIQSNNCSKLKVWWEYSFVQGIKDRLDFKEMTGSRLGASYQISPRWGLSINFGNKKYTGEIEEIFKYPFLKDLIPHHPTDSLIETDVFARMKSLGFGIDYSILRLKNFSLIASLNFEKEYYSDFDFELEIIDDHDKKFEERKRINIIEKDRFFINPEIKAEYSLYKGLGIYADAGFSYSLSPLNEQYMNYNLGLVYNF